MNPTSQTLGTCTQNADKKTTISEKIVDALCCIQKELGNAQDRLRTIKTKAFGEEPCTAACDNVREFPGIYGDIDYRMDAIRADLASLHSLISTLETIV